MAKQDDDFSAFDDAVSQPAEDFSAFDQAHAAHPESSILQKLLAKGQSAVTPSNETIRTATNVANTLSDLPRGAAQGMTFNALDELGGALGAGVEKGLEHIPFVEKAVRETGNLISKIPGFEEYAGGQYSPSEVNEQLATQGIQVPKESMLDKYRQYQQGIEQNLSESAERSPILNTLGQIGGGITSGTALGGLLGVGKAASGAKSIAEIAKDSGKAKAAMELLKRGGVNYAKAAPAIAAESALTSKEQLIGPNANPEGVAGDVMGGLAFGLPAVLGMQGITDVAVPAAQEKLAKAGQKVSELAAESPLFRQAKLAYQKYGQEYKVNPRNEKAIKEGVEGIEGGTPFALLDKTRAGGIADDVLKKDSQLGAIVGSSLDEASQAGQKIDAQDLVSDTYKKVVAMAEEMPSLTKDENFNKIISKTLSRNYKDASPRDIKNAMDDISNSIERINSYRLPSPELQDALPLLRDFRRGLDQRLKTFVPEYRDAAERFAQYRSTYIEQPIAGGNDPQLDDIYYGSMKKGDLKLQNAYEDLVKRSTGDSQAHEGTEERYAKLLQKAKEFQKNEQGRVAAGKIESPISQDPAQFMQQIKNMADDAAVRRTTRDVQSTQAGTTLAAKTFAGITNTGRGALLTGSYLAGRATSAPLSQSVSKMSRAVYNAPAQTLSNLAAKLESNSAFSAVGKALREGLENNDGTKRNAALFTIMQNPNSRALISSEDFPEEEEK